MTHLLNNPPFAAHMSLGFDSQGQQHASVVLKATLSFPEPAGLCRPAPEQMPIMVEPEYMGQPGASSIRYPADVGPINPGTDVVFVGHAYAPSLQPVQKAEVQLRVGPLCKTVMVFGEREWTPTLMGPVMSAPVPFTRMPMVYERAFGGSPPSERGRTAPRIEERNPIGTGYCVRREDYRGMRLPNLEHPDHPIRSWRQKPPVCGFGAVDAHWIPRRSFAGTHDARWKRERCPLPAEDFDERFHSIAAEGLWSPTPLEGELEVELRQLSVEPFLSFRIPAAVVDMAFSLPDSILRRRAALCRLLLEPDAQRLVMLWGASCPVGKRPSALTVVELNLKWA